MLGEGSAVLTNILHAFPWMNKMRIIPVAYGIEIRAHLQAARDVQAILLYSPTDGHLIHDSRHSAQVDENDESHVHPARFCHRRQSWALGYSLLI